MSVGRECGVSVGVGEGVWGGSVGYECGMGMWGGSVGWECGVGMWG